MNLRRPASVALLCSLIALGGSAAAHSGSPDAEAARLARRVAAGAAAVPKDWVDKARLDRLSAALARLPREVKPLCTSRQEISSTLRSPYGHEPASLVLTPSGPAVAALPRNRTSARRLLFSARKGRAWSTPQLLARVPERGVLGIDAAELYAGAGGTLHLLGSRHRYLGFMRKGISRNVFHFFYRRREPATGRWSALRELKANPRFNFNLRALPQQTRKGAEGLLVAWSRDVLRPDGRMAPAIPTTALVDAGGWTRPVVLRDASRRRLDVVDLFGVGGKNWLIASDPRRHTRHRIYAWSKGRWRPSGVLGRRSYSTATLGPSPLLVRGDANDLEEGRRQYRAFIVAAQPGHKRPRLRKLGDLNLPGIYFAGRHRAPVSLALHGDRLVGVAARGGALYLLRLQGQQTVARLLVGARSANAPARYPRLALASGRAHVVWAAESAEGSARSTTLWHCEVDIPAAGWTPIEKLVWRATAGVGLSLADRETLQRRVGKRPYSVPPAILKTVP